MNYEPVSPTNLPKSAITDLAEKVALEFGYDPAAPLEDIVTAFGGIIEYKNMREVEKTNDGSIQIEEDGRFKIFLPDYVSVERNRFTIAHELGHLMGLDHFQNGGLMQGNVFPRSSRLFQFEIDTVNPT